MSNFTDISRTNLSYSTELKLDHNWEIVFLTMAYVLVFIVGVVGNSFVLAVVVRSPHMWNVTNLFIANLAAADILVLLFCLPFNLVNSLFASYPFSDGVCKTVVWLQAVSVSSSVNTLATISVERYISIVYPMKYEMTTKAAGRFIAVIWIYSCLTFIPWLLYYDAVDIVFKGQLLSVCGEFGWHDPAAAKWYFLCVVALQCYIVPLAVISVCYFLIFLHVLRRPVIGETRDLETLVRKQKLKLAKMVLVVVLLFAFCWLPLYLTFAFVYFGVVSSNNSRLALLIPICQWISTSNSGIDPVLYAFLNRRFRLGFIAVLKSRSCCGELRYPHDRNTKYYNGRLTNSTQQRRIVVKFMCLTWILHERLGRSTVFRLNNDKQDCNFCEANVNF